jgi:hypothetical protein
MAGRFGSQNQQRQAQTQGVLFNRPNPRGLNGESVKLIGRDGKETDRNNYVFNQGKDITSLDDRSRFKYRVPSNSVVNKVGDCKMFLCCGWKLTAAQTLWLMHLLAFCCHTAMVFVTAWAAWWRKDMKTLYGDENPYLVTVMRLSAKWDNTTTQGYQITAEDNGMPIDLAWGCLCFFLLSAIAHLFSLTMGLFEATWFIFWRQLDDCFVYWRWIEYSGSASLMGMLLALTLGIREENTLACLFMLIWVTNIVGGLLNELYSRPSIEVDVKNYQWAVGKLGFTGPPDYAKDPRALHIIAGDTWEGDRPVRDGNGKPIEGPRKFNSVQRWSNFVRRQVPYFTAWFPYILYVFIVVFHLENSKKRLYDETDGTLQIPSWVNSLLYGTLLLFTSFGFVMPVFQALPPSAYFGSEYAYIILSLTAKMFLGGLILFNVIMQEARADSTLGAGGLETA